MLVFYIVFVLIGLLGMLAFGGNPVFCGLLMGVGLAGGIAGLFIRGKLRIYSAVLIPVCVVLCLFMGWTVREGGMGDYEARIRQAQTLIDKGELEEGKELLAELDGEFGTTDPSCYARADIYIRLADYRTAQTWVEKVENRSDGRWYEYMETILSLRDSSDALEKLNELYLSGAENLPGNGHLQYMAGLVKLSQGNYQTAAYYFRRAEDMGEEVGASNYYLGVISYEQGDRETAFQYFEEALKQGVDWQKENNIQWYRERQGA